MNAAQRRKMDLLLARFVEAMTAWGWSRRTIPSYEENIRVFLEWLESETDITSLAEVTAETLASYQAALLSQERKSRFHPCEKSGEKIATATQRQRLGTVRSFFRFLAQEGKLLSNPAAGLTLPKVRRGLPQALLTPKEAIRLLEAPDVTTALGLRNRAILEVFYSSGIRNAELRGLSLSDFDPAAETLLVRQGKGNKDRVVPLGPVAAAVLSDYMAKVRPQLAKSPGITQLFLSRGGLPLGAPIVIRIVRRAAEAAGIRKPIRPHRLRHACATHMLKGGADIRHIQKLLGHASLQTTQIYTQVEISDLKAVHRRFHPRERR